MEKTMVLKTNNFSLSILLLSFLVIIFLPLEYAFSQVEGIKESYIRIGSLQNHFTAYGSERATTGQYYKGLQWPAQYPYTDNAVIERHWFGVKDFVDEQGREWNYYGIHSTAGYIGNSIFPVKHEQTARFELPMVLVDGINIKSQYIKDIDDYDSDQIPDRIISNVYNTSMGITVERKILAFSQEYHDKYFIYEYTFTNTGKTDYSDDVKLQRTIYGFMVTWQPRYSVSREGSFSIGGSQSWGQHSWVTKRGEDYPQHAGEQITEDDPIPHWLRAGFSWAGQRAANSWDNVGGPYRDGDGRLRAIQHAGRVVLHVDKSTSDNSDDPQQPHTLGWHAGDTYPSVGDMSPSSAPQMTQLYRMLEGNPHNRLGGNFRMDEAYLETNPDPSTVHGDVGGTNVWMAFGPWDIEHGESIRIILAEGVNGIDRQTATRVGRQWLRAQRGEDDGPFVLPDGSTTTDENEFKNAWVYTGKDSIMQTFGRAYRNFKSGYNIPQPPLPPPLFEINSGGDRIVLEWVGSPSEGNPDFAGYKIYRAVGKPDTTFELIATVEPGGRSYNDLDAQRGNAYYYYIAAYSDGSNNNTGETNPRGELHSGMFYTMTTEPAYLQRAPGKSLSDIRVVPNPYNIRSRRIQYPGEPDKIMFLNIPGKCTIRIYTERGDLIEIIEHDDGSGDATWNSITKHRQVVVSGVYIAHFTVNEDQHDPETDELLYRAGETVFRKFVIIR
jgi:hypothetical protein